MEQQEELESKRQEVREEILALKEKIPPARILNVFGRWSKNRGLEYLLINVVFLNLIALGPWILIGLVLDENVKTINFLILGIIGAEVAISGFILGHIVIQNVFDDIASAIVEKISNANDISRLLHWLKTTWSIENIAAFVLPYSALWATLAVVSWSVVLDEFTGFGFLLTTVTTGLIAGIATYNLVWANLFASKLKDYQYEINTFSSADSEVLYAINEMLTKPVYILAAFFAIVTLVNSSNLVDRRITVVFTLPLLLIAWTAITTPFLLTRSTIAKIVNRVKWKTLNKIQAQMNSLQATGDLSDKETAERLLRLADIHAHIVASRSSIFDLKSVTTLLTQLMLPLLGVIIGNLDTLLPLLR